MSLPHDTLVEIQSLADGELEGEARLRVEKLVTESAEARSVLEGLRAPHVGMWLTDAVDRRATAAGVDRIAENVMGRLSGDRLSAGDSGARGDAGVVARIDRPARRAPLRAFPRAAVTTGVTALALAAGVAFVLRSGGRPSDAERMPVASVGLPNVDMQGPPTQPSGGVEVDEVDSPSRGVSVFEIPLRSASARAGGTSASSVVIWIDDEGAK
jgi:hypothetical protein